MCQIDPNDGIFKSLIYLISSIIFAKQFLFFLTRTQDWGLDVWDAWSFFKLLDLDAGGSVEIEEFFKGCLRRCAVSITLPLAELYMDFLDFDTSGWAFFLEMNQFTFKRQCGKYLNRKSPCELFIEKRVGLTIPIPLSST